MAAPEQPVMKEQTSRQRSFRGARGGAALSLALGLISVALNLWPAGLVLPLQSWLGEFIPLFLPLAVGVTASGLAVLSLVRAPKCSWFAIVGLVFGVIGMALGSLFAVVTVTMLLHYDARRIRSAAPAAKSLSAAWVPTCSMAAPATTF
jgi:hypothetical protein